MAASARLMPMVRMKSRIGPFSMANGCSTLARAVRSDSG
jgi:hypothetical protein